MIFNKPIYDRIFETLAENKEYSIQSLHQKINEKEKISLPNFYKIIDQLLENQILSKEQGKIKLHSTWIISFLDLADKIKQNYFNNNSMEIDLKEGEQKSFYASSLRDLDNIWANLLSTIGLKYGKNESFYFYNAHTYHILGMQETESTNFRNFGKQTQKVYFLAGNETTLDLYGADLLRLQGTDVVCSDKVKFLKDGYCINIIGDYMIEVFFPTILSQYFKAFFDNTKDIGGFNPELFQNIFKMKSECKLTIRRSITQTTSLKKEIKKFFK